MSVCKVLPKYPRIFNEFGVTIQTTEEVLPTVR